MPYDANQPTTSTNMTVTNKTIGGSCFAVEHGSGESIFIPASVSIRADLSVGDTLTGDVIDNPMEASRERTKYMAVHVSVLPASAPVAAQAAPDSAAQDARNFTSALLADGGCWNNIDVFREYMHDYEANQGDDPVAYAAVGNELRRMFSADLCAKFSLYRTASQSRSSVDWYTCEPDKCEPAEWADENE